jgi:hypothetical protein
MTFSADDIQASVEKLVLSSIRRPYDTLGTRRVDISFNDIQEAAAGVFLLVTSAPFYIAFLGAQQLLELIKTEEEIILALLDAIDATGRKVFPIKDLTPLNNASAALFELEAAVGRRSQSFKTIETTPAYQQFKNNLDLFLSTAGANIKAGGVIVQTPQEARSNIPSLLASLKSSHAELVRRATVLASAMDDYAKVNLPALAAAGVIARARVRVQQHAQTLEGLGETERLSVLRPIVLDLLSSKAVVRKYGSFAAPTTLLTLNGVGNPYSDAAHTANGGSVVGDVMGPFALTSGVNTIDLRLDAVTAAKVVGSVDTIVQVNGYKASFNRASGSFVADAVAPGDVVYVTSGLNTSTRWTVLSVATNTLQAMGTVLPQADSVTAVEIWPAVTESIPLALSYVASIEGSVREPFLVVAGQSDLVGIGINGAQISASLTAGSKSAQQVATAINSAISGAGLATVAVAEPYLSPLRFDGIVDLSVVGSTGTFQLQVGTLNNLGVTVGDLLQVLSGPNAGLVLPITAVAAVPTTNVTADGFGLVADTGVRIQIGPVGRKVRVRFLSPAAALTGVSTLSCSADPTAAGAGLLLGFPSGATFTSRRTRATELVNDFNSKSTRGRADRILTSVASTALGRSKPENVSAIVLYTFRGHGDVVAVPGSVTVTVALGGLLAAGVMAGELLVLRTGADPDSTWAITSVTDTVLVATGGSTTSGLGLEIEVGPHLSSVAGRLLQITNGPNAGEYTVTGTTGSVPFDLLLEGALPFFRDTFSQPVLFGASLYKETIQISSKNATTASRVTANGFGLSAISSTTPLVGGGTTTWLQLPAIPGDIRIGDFLDTFLNDYKMPTDSFMILSVDASLKVIELDHALNSTVPWTFGDKAPPFARLRSGRAFNYTVLQTRLFSWASLPANQPAFFTDLSRFLNPLLVGENPTDVQVNDAKTHLLGLAGFLSIEDAALVGANAASTLESILEDYVVEPVAEVDTLLRSFKEKGSDRATDLLTEGQFTTFFGLSIDGASYSGNMQEKMREVARLDLPVRKVDRDDASSSRQLAEVEDVDYEYSKDDIDDVQIDPPVD